MDRHARPAAKSRVSRLAANIRAPKLRNIGVGFELVLRIGRARHPGVTDLFQVRALITVGGGDAVFPIFDVRRLYFEVL